MRILSPILFLLVLMVKSDYVKACPDPEEIYPCKCEEHDKGQGILVTCSSGINNLQQLKTALNSLHLMSDVELHLENLNLGTVPSNFFYGIEVKVLHIFNCKFNSLTQKDYQPALSGLENTLEELYISYSSSEDNILPKLKLGHMRKLRELKVYSTNITELGNDWFDNGPASLKELIMYRNIISKVGDKVFANLNNLERLTFQSTVCGDTLKRSMFPDPANRLQSLDVDKSCLKEIPEDLFKGMPSLEYIYLRDNKLTRLEQSHWLQIWQQLRIINLKGNPLECDSHMDWIFKLKTTRDIGGKCAAPPERKGLSLFEFIHGRGY